MSTWAFLALRDRFVGASEVMSPSFEVRNGNAGFLTFATFIACADLPAFFAAQCRLCANAIPITFIAVIASQIFVHRERASVKCWAKFAALLLSVAAIQASTQSAPEGKSGAQETQMQSYWIDPSTGLMWAGKDNGKDVNWHKAVKYCRDLRLAGYSDWRLATIGELGQIYDKDANAPGLAGPSKKQHAFTFHVKGNLFLTGDQWGSTQSLDDRGHPSGYAWRFDFNEGQSFEDDLSFYSNKRALCVRASKK